MEPKVVIATTMLYKDATEVRLGLALETLYNLTECNRYGVVVYDGSPPSVREPLKRLGQRRQSIMVFDEPEGNTMGQTRRLAIAKAAEIAGSDGSDGIVGWIEPEKNLAKFIRACVAPILRARLGLPDAYHIVIPSRTDNLASYQKFQQHAELFGNDMFRYILGIPIDAWFGPRFFGVEDAHWFTDYKGEYGDRWDSIFIPLLRAHAAGRVLGNVEINFTHPVAQAANEDSLNFYLKRLEQLSLVPILMQEALRLGIVEERFFGANLKALARTWRQALANIT